MFSLLKSAIKKDSATKAEANGGNLDDFLKKGEEKDAPNGESKDGIKSIRNQFRASEYGLVIKDLDMEKTQVARNQSASTLDKTIQPQAEANEQKSAVTPDHVKAQGSIEDVSMQAPPVPDRNIEEGLNADEQPHRDIDNEEGDREQSEILQSGEDGLDQAKGESANETSSKFSDQVSAQEEDNPNLPGWTPKNLDTDETAGAGEMEHTGDDGVHLQGEQFSNGSHDEAANPGQQGDNEQFAEENTDSLVNDIDENMGRDTALGDNENEVEVEEWRPRDLDAENPESDRQLDLQDPDCLQSEDGAIDNAADDEEPIECDQTRGFDDYQFEQGYDSRDDASLQGALTPNRDDADEMDEMPESYDDNSNFDDSRLEQDDIDRDETHLETEQDNGEGEYFEEQNDEFVDDVGSEMADSLRDDGEVLDQADVTSGMGDHLSEDDFGGQPKEAEELLDPTADYAGEGYGSEAEQNPITSDDLSEADDGLGKDEIPEEDEELDGNNDVDANEELGEDGLEAAEKDASDIASNAGSQADQEPVAENPLSVPGKQWTEEHLAAFLIHVQSKANIFDFFTRKGVSNHERVSEIITQSLKLCLKDTSKEDTTALRSKKHATIFMEAGGTPLGPFVAFLALTVQSTSKDERKKDEKKKDEKNTEDPEQAKEDEVSEPASPADEADSWDDFDLDNDLEAAPSYFEPPKPKPVAPKSGHDGNVVSKQLEVATNIMVVMFLQAVLETSRAAILEPAKAYLEWTFIPQALKISSLHANCEDENYGSLHEKRGKQTAGDRLKWEDVNPLEYVSIGVNYLLT
jgi:hypothetical protein